MQKPKPIVPHKRLVDGEKRGVSAITLKKKEASQKFSKDILKIVSLFYLQLVAQVGCKLP